MAGIHSGSNSCECVTLHSISGKSVTLPYPTTFKAVFNAAVALPFSFVPETVKIHAGGRLVNVADYLKQHSSEKDGGFLDASAYAVASTSSVSAGISHETVTAAVRLSNGTTATTAALSGVVTAAATTRRRSSPTRTLIVYGLPRRVKALCNPAGVEMMQNMSSSAGALQTASSLPSSSPAVTATGAGKDGVTAGGTMPATALATTATNTNSNKHNGFVTGRPVKNNPLMKRSVTHDPLPYPHSPNGLLELQRAVSTLDSDADDDDDLISILQGAPQRIYNHPTMCYISNKVKGNLMTLRAVMEQIYRVAPVFYAWVEANPQKFLSALNRVGERSLQQVKDQLRLLALQAVVGQISGDGPSRRVMMLEVSTRDGMPDVYQVEVQVGDFSDNDGEDADIDGDDSSSDVESLFYAGMEQSDERDFLGEVEEEGGEEGEGEGEEGENATTMTASETDSAHTEEEDDDGRHGDFFERRAAAADRNELEHTDVLRAGAEVDEEPHRGTILLPPTGASTSVKSTGEDAAAAAIITSQVTTTPQNAMSATPTPPPGSAPVRPWRLSPDTFTTLSTAAASSPSSVETAATSTATASAEAAAAVTDVFTDQHYRHQHDHDDDARLVRLHEASHAVEALRDEYTRRGDDGTARRTHEAIMDLRPKFFATVGDVCSYVFSTAAASALNSRDEVKQHSALLRRVVRCACDFFVNAEEFYAQLEEEGVRASVFGPSPQESLAAWAAIAALSRLLMCDVDAAAQAAIASSGASGSYSDRTDVVASNVNAGLRRVGALRSLHADNSLWSNPAVQWAFTRGPEELLAAVLQLCRQQRAVLVWYSSHYLLKAVGKTIQTMAYIFGGTEEAQQPVALQRLKMTSKAHKSDEVADLLCELSSSGSESGVSDGSRRQWMGLMRTRYQQFVRPIEGDLPTPHMKSNTLYICDTRHVLPPKEPTSEDCSRSATAFSPSFSSPSVGSAARWWAGYCDDHHTMCADKWCLAATLRPWNAALASANAQDARDVERTAVCLVSSGAGAPNSLTEDPTSLFHSLLPTDQVIVGDAVSASGSSASAARHTVVLYERVPLSSAETAMTNLSKLTNASKQGLCPRFVGDIHVIDVMDSAAQPSQAASTRLEGGAGVSTHLATVARNYLLPQPASVPHRSVFLNEFFEMFARHPQISAAAAARHAALANASANDAPWLVCEYVLLDYGGAIRSLTSAANASCVATPSESNDVHHTADATATEDFVRMPTVPLGRRLSEPRPVSVVSRTRSTSQSDVEGRTTTTAAAPSTTTATSAAEDAVKRQYARTHAIDELYEMMLGSLLDHQPTGEQNVLDHLVSYLEGSEGVMREKVQRRQAEVKAAAAAAPAGTATIHDTISAAPASFSAPQPPNVKQNSKGRPSFRHRKSSS